MHYQTIKYFCLTLHSLINVRKLYLIHLSVASVVFAEGWRRPSSILARSPHHIVISFIFCLFVWYGSFSFWCVFLGVRISHSYPSYVAEVGLTFPSYYTDFFLSFLLQKHLLVKCLNGRHVAQ